MQKGYSLQGTELQPRISVEMSYESQVVTNH